MSIQPTGTTAPAFQPSIADDTTGRRNVTTTSEATAHPLVETQAQYAADQTKAATTASSKAINKEDLERHLNKINEFVQTRASNVQFLIDKETGIHIVRVVDTSTKELIRQFPSEEVVHIAQALDHLQGLLIRQKA